ncbi:MAG: hypothetical protein JXL84_19610 [Deltaproteobacteria bacterium]|nr:hypothetical protein [Deltaproteobacteria bacterium]
MNTRAACEGTSISGILSTSRFQDGGTGDSRLTSWLKLLLGIALIVLFMIVMGPFEKLFPGMESMSRFIDERGIKATALYYTDIDEFGDATASLRDYLEYSHEE